MLFPTHRFLEIVMTQDVSQVQSILHGETLSRLFAGRLVCEGRETGEYVYSIAKCYLCRTEE